jgi:hypothetical protein
MKLSTASFRELISLLIGRAPMWQQRRGVNGARAAAAVFAIVLFCHVVRAANLINGQPGKVAGVTTFTLWEDGDPHDVRWKGFRALLQKGENAILLPEDEEQRLLEKPLIEAPPGFVVAAEQLSIHRNEREEKSPFSSQITNWTGYKIQGTWIVTPAKVARAGYYHVRIMFPAIDAKLKELEAAWRAQMKAEFPEYTPREAVPLFLELNFELYPTREELVRAVDVTPNLQNAALSLFLFLLVSGFFGAFVWGIQVSPFAVVPLLFFGFLCLDGAFQFFKCTHSALVALWSVDRTEAFLTGAAISCGLFAIGVVCLLRVEKSIVRTLFALGHVTSWCVLTVIAVPGWLLANAGVLGHGALSDVRYSFPLALPLVLIGVGPAVLLHWPHLWRMLRLRPLSQPFLKELRALLKDKTT